MAKKVANKEKQIKVFKTKNEKIMYISDFLNTYYREYVHYILKSRALPSLMDGLKVGARKILHAAFTGSIKNGSTVKLLVLSGDTMRLSLYIHGDASLNDTIVTLSQPFTYNIHPIEGVGQVGSLRDPKAVSAPRYLEVKLSKYADIWKTDYDMLDYVFDEGRELEPVTYLPVVPTVLMNRAEGMAPGYRFSTLSYNPIDIIDACITCLNSRKKNPLDGFVIRPFVRGYDNKHGWETDDKGRLVSCGKYKYDSKKGTLNISELPFKASYDDFEQMLNKLVDGGTLKEWKDHSQNGNINYDITFMKGVTMTTAKLISTFKLRKVVPDDSLWVVDENDKVKHFNTPQELVEYFVTIRLGLYDERKSRLVKKLTEKFKDNCELIRFIELVCKGKLKIRNRSKKDIEADMKKEKLSMSLISTAMSRCTIEERDELLKQNKELEKYIEYIKKTTTKKMYLDDLNKLRKELEGDFKV